MLIRYRFFFFFFKQKTAYEMRISDWSSDVCSSDYLVDAGSRRITLGRGATIVDSAASFAMIRGGHIDVTILGAFEVAENGDLANWDMRVPKKGPLVGGAMDLAVGAKAVWIIMEHNTRSGGSRLLTRSEEHTSELQSLMRISYAVF